VVAALMTQVTSRIGIVPMFGTYAYTPAFWPAWWRRSTRGRAEFQDAEHSQ
jgi:hypothetical protein